jgi:hypothetical protein
MRWSRRTPEEEPDDRPEPATLYSAYIKRKPPQPLPRDSAGQPLPVALLAYGDPLGEAARTRLALALERHQPAIIINDPRFRNVADVMAYLAIERMVEVRGDLSLRDSGYGRRTPWQRLGEMLFDTDVTLVLDAAGAWVDAYAALPGVRWLREMEAAYLAAVDEALIDTRFAVRGREIILREDLGASVLIDKPLAALITTNPALREVDAKLREALEELDSGNAADAVTDAGTALQMLLSHLGHQGQQLGDQVKAARKAGWLNGVDRPLADAVESVVAWVSSVRNQRSDAHHTPPPDRRDAELVIRMVGLLTLRFA